MLYLTFKTLVSSGKVLLVYRYVFYDSAKKKHHFFSLSHCFGLSHYNLYSLRTQRHPNLSFRSRSPDLAVQNEWCETT